MRKEEFEAKVLEHIIAISDLYAEYNPEARDVLDITIHNNVKNGNRNDFGSWNTQTIFCCNRKTLQSSPDLDGVNFYACKDIEDESFRRANLHESTSNKASWKKYNLGTICKEDFWDYLDSFGILEIEDERLRYFDDEL